MTNEQLEKMQVWVDTAMTPEQWYPVKTDAAFDALNILFEEGAIPFCEMDSKQLHIRKITFDYPKPITQRKNEISQHTYNND